MAKVIIQQILDAGFRADQFGAPGDWDSGNGYLGRLIADVAAVAQARVGDALYAATGVTAIRIARGELYLCIAELWRRRAAFLDSGTATALAQPQSRIYQERAEYMAAAQSAKLDADAWLSDAITSGAAQDTGGGVSFGYAESGPYASLVTS